MQMSSTAWCFSQKQYASCTTTYTASTITSCTDASRLTATDAPSSTTATATASRGGTTPAAIGRNRLVGCARSAATSFASLTR